MHGCAACCFSGGAWRRECGTWAPPTPAVCSSGAASRSLQVCTAQGWGPGAGWVRGWGWQCDGTAVTAKRRLPATMSTAGVGRSVPQALLPPDWMPSAEPAFHRTPPFSRWRAALAPPADGSLGSRTALFHQPYADQPGSGGTRTIALETLRQLVAGADAAGLQVGAPLLQAVSSAVHPVHPCAGHVRHSRFLAGPE